MSDLRGDPESMYCDLCKQMKGTHNDCVTASGRLKLVCMNVNCDRYLDKYIEEYFSKKPKKSPEKEMRILEVQESKYLEIEFECGTIHYCYRRYTPEIWEKQYGESWESVTNPEKVEKVYQLFLKNKGAT
jgi:hypothetical protein